MHGAIYLVLLLLNEVRIKLATSELPACIVFHSILLSKLASSSSLPSSLVHNKKPQLIYTLHSTFVGSFA
jgi:hypothetical protein